jgi:hypothetical protein
MECGDYDDVCVSKNKRNKSATYYCTVVFIVGLKFKTDCLMSTSASSCLLCFNKFGYIV